MNFCANNESNLRNRQKYNDNLAYSVNVDDKSTTLKSTLENNNSVSNGNKTKRIKALVNHEYCSYCDEGGNLLNCDRCPVSFHLLCHEPPLDQDQIPKGEFLCNKCKTKAKLLPFHNMNIIDPNEKLIELPISNETKYVEFLRNDKDTALEALIKLSKSLNPRQMTLSAPLCKQLDIDIPGLNKNKWWNRDYRLASSLNHNTNGYTHDIALNNGNLNNPIEKELNEQRITRNSLNNDYSNNNIILDKLNSKNDSQSLSKLKICFNCRKSVKLDRLAKCDFCPLSYHLDCLNPPICATPSREKLWMCPNHIEHYLEQYMLDSSSRLSERIKLWNKFSIAKNDTDHIIKNFLDKCHSSDLIENVNTNKIRGIKRCKVPSPIRNSYAKESENQYDDHKISQEIEDNDDMDLEENENDNKLQAVEALILLSESKIEKTKPLSNPKINNIQLETPSLNKKNVKATKPRALLQFVSNINMCDCNNSDELNYLPLFNITNRSITVGYGQKVDICLKSITSKSNLKKVKKCDFISEKHACIYYDELTNCYELINYSQYGTYVNNSYYGFNLNANDEDDNENDDDDDDENDLDVENGDIGNINRTKKSCLCRKTYNETENDTYFRQYEGAASLSHGSVLRFGCYEFLFIVVDYDFVRFNLEKKIDKKCQILKSSNNNEDEDDKLTSHFISSKLIEYNKFLKRSNNNNNNKKNSVLLKKNNTSKKKLSINNGKLNNNKLKSLNNNGTNNNHKLNRLELKNEILNSFLNNENKKLLLI